MWCINYFILLPADDEEEEDERLSVTSEPSILADLGTPNMKRRDRPYSEGASPCTTPRDEVTFSYFCYCYILNFILFYFLVTISQVLGEQER